MKKTTLALLAFCFATIMTTVFSCQKPYNSKGVPQSFNRLFAGLRSTPQGLSVQAGRDTVVFGSKGTMFHFYTNSFKDAAGNIITSGSIYLQLTEMYKPGDMVANRATTMAGDQPLKSGGQILIVATKDGQEVFANKYGIGFGQSGSSGAPMELFFGNTNTADSVVTWAAGTGTTGTTTDGTKSDTAALAHFDSSNHNYPHPPKPWYYIFDSCTSFNFVNCDHPFTSGCNHIFSNLTVPDGTFNKTNTYIYICLTEYNSVVGNAYLGSATTGNMINGAFYAPPGAAYKLVAMSNIDGAMYYYETYGTIPADSLNLSLALASDTQADILARLAGL